MLNELRKFDCLGTPEYFYELFCALRNDTGKPWRLNDVKKIFHNRVIDNRPIIDGGIELGRKIKLIEVNENKIYLDLNMKNHLKTISQMIDQFNIKLFDGLRTDPDFLTIFSSKHLSYDIIYQTLQLNNSAFGFKYSNFKQLLLDFKIIQRHPTKQFDSFTINQKYKKLFDKSVLPAIKKKKIGVEEFKKSMEKKQIYGEEAEKFVLLFEKNRLENKKVINWVAEYIVNEGYDIASYNKINDSHPNRFIEVKSYAGKTPYFFWSRNEYLVAKEKRMSYWLYLVNRDQINDINYHPIMIQNPIESILKNDKEWNYETEQYKCKMKKI